MSLYLILMNPSENEKSLYRGAITIMDGKPWYVTSLARPSIFKLEKKAHSEMSRLAESYPDREFMAVTVDFYLTLIGKSLDRWSNSWINQLRQEQLSL